MNVFWNYSAWESNPDKKSALTVLLSNYLCSFFETQLEEKKKYLEHHWVLAQKELDQEKALHTKLQVETQKDHEDVIKEERGKLERTTHENENRLADMKKAHTEQCEELSREALKAKLEADRLYNELIARGVDVPRHMLFSDKDNSTKNVNPALSLFLFLLAISSIVSSLTRFLNYH